MAEYGKSPIFLVKENSPYNGEPPLERLVQALITPTAEFFARNHGDIPEMDAHSHHLEVGGLVEQPLLLSIDELRADFPPFTLTATLQCAGNRREELIAHAPIPGELPWASGAIGTAVWRGARLADVLEAAGVQPEAAHVHLTGLDQVERLGRTFGFGGSIPLAKALQPEVLLAYEMNGALLNAAHGAPLRLVAPGYIGARSVKWLGHINVLDTPSENYFYARAYQLFPGWVHAGNVDWPSGIKLGDLPVTSVICDPQDGERVRQNPATIRGYAFVGGGRRIERVDVSIDGGTTWQAAELGEDAGPWAWRLWQAQAALPVGESEIVARAVDSACNTQPETVEQVWNFKGYMNNSWHRVRVRV